MLQVKDTASTSTPSLMNGSKEETSIELALTLLRTSSLQTPITESGQESTGEDGKGEQQEAVKPKENGNGERTTLINAEVTKMSSLTKLYCQKIMIGSKNNHKQLLPHFTINIIGNQVSPAQNVQNLGVMFDSNLSLSDHKSQAIKSTRVNERDLYRICPLLGPVNRSILVSSIWSVVSTELGTENAL